MKEFRSPLFLVSTSPTPCGVETFARRLQQTWRERTSAGEVFEICDNAGLSRLWRALDDADSLVVNFPLVAWKRRLFLPPLAIFLARTRGKMSVAIVHEWRDLDWRRRILIGIYSVFTQRILFSSPSVRRQFEYSAFGRMRRGHVVVVPPNLRRPEQRVVTAWSEQVEAARSAGKLTLGHFGSIYPKKQCDFLLDVAAELKRRGQEIFVVYIGNFIKATDRVEEEFDAKVAALGLTDDVTVTGYVATEAELFTIFEAVDVFVYAFAEGLTSRRGSVLACLQSGRPLVVNAPEGVGEFDHHSAFRRAIETGTARLVPTHATIADYADAVQLAAKQSPPAPMAIYEQGWREAAQSLASALVGRSVGVDGQLFDPGKKAHDQSDAT